LIIPAQVKQIPRLDFNAFPELEIYFIYFAQRHGVEAFLEYFSATSIYEMRYFANSGRNPISTPDGERARSSSALLHRHFIAIYRRMPTTDIALSASRAAMRFGHFSRFIFDDRQCRPRPWPITQAVKNQMSMRA